MHVFLALWACTREPTSTDTPAPADDTDAVDDSGGHTGETDGEDYPLLPGWWEGALDTVDDGCGFGLVVGGQASAFLAPAEGGDTMILDGTIPMSFLDGGQFVGAGSSTFNVPDIDCITSVAADVLGYYSDDKTITKLDRNESFSFEGADCASQPGGGQACTMATTSHLAWDSADPPEPDTGGR